MPVAPLSAEAQAAIDLANARADEQALELARITAALDKSTYEQERDTLARVHGIPPRITDLARELLEGTGRVVELANGRSVDAGSIMRKVLAEVGKTVDLSTGISPDSAAEEKRVTDRAELDHRLPEDDPHMTAAARPCWSASTRPRNPGSST